MSALVGSLEFEARRRQGLIGANNMITVGFGSSQQQQQQPLPGGDYGNVFSDRDIEELLLYIDSPPKADNNNSCFLAGVAEYIKQFCIRKGPANEDCSAFASDPPSNEDVYDDARAAYVLPPSAAKQHGNEEINGHIHKVIVEERENGYKMIKISSPNRDWIRSDVSIVLQRLSLEICKATMSMKMDQIEDMFHVRSSSGNDVPAAEIKRSLECVVTVWSSAERVAQQTTASPDGRIQHGRVDIGCGSFLEGGGTGGGTNGNAHLGLGGEKVDMILGGGPAPTDMAMMMTPLPAREELLMGSYPFEAQRAFTRGGKAVVRGGKVLGGSVLGNRVFNVINEDKRKSCMLASVGILDENGADIHDEKRLRISTY